MTVSAQTGLNWFLLSLQTANSSDKYRYCRFHHQDFRTKYFFLLWYDDVYCEWHTAVDISVAQGWKNLYLKILMRKTLKNCPKLQLWLFLVGFLKYSAHMLYIPKSLYDLHKYFRFFAQCFNIMKNLCKRAMT